MSKIEDREITSEDIRRLSLSVCYLARALSERNIIEGFRVAVQTMSQKNMSEQLSAKAVENNELSLQSVILELERQLRLV